MSDLETLNLGSGSNAISLALHSGGKDPRSTAGMAQSHQDTVGWVEQNQMSPARTGGALSL